MMFDGGLELLDVFCSSLSERCLRLAVSLFSFFRGCVDLLKGQHILHIPHRLTYRLPPPFSLLDLRDFLCMVLAIRFLIRIREFIFVVRLHLGDSGCVADT